jgi:uridine kinase
MLLKVSSKPSYPLIYSQNFIMKVIFIGLSGPSSSGKPTLANLLKQIFPNVAYVLHAADFCK